MRSRISVLASVSLAALAFGTVAFAGEMQAAQASSAEAPGQASAGDTATGVTEVVVTGLRKSLQSAETIKRRSVQQVDSIVAEDIGKLPDITVSDTAARIVGVQVSRADGEASNVLIRGLPNFTTTYDGREIFTAEARLVALEDFPAAAIGAIEAYKTTTADMVEGGLAGELNVQSRRPFDFAGRTVAGMIWGQYETRSRNYDPNGNLLVSDRWNTGAGEVGALLGLSYTRLRYLDSQNSNTDYVANDPVGPGGANVRFPDIQRIDYNVGDRERPSMNASLQWRPMAGLEFYADGLWQGFRDKVSDRELEAPLWGGSSYTNVVTQGSGPNPRVVSLTVTDPFAPDGWQGATYAQTDTYQFAVGGKYDADRFHAAFDVAHTQSRFLDSIYSMDMAYAAPQVVTANTGIDGLSQGPTFHFAPGFDPSNPANYFYRGFFDRQLIATGRDWQTRLDLAYDRPLPFITRLEAGFRYVDRDGHHEDGSRYNYRLPDQLPFSAIPVSYTVFSSGFPSDNPTAIRGYLVPTYDSIRSNIAALRAFSGFAPGAPPPDPALTFTANEKSYAGYVQAKYAFDLGVPVDGAVGVRVVDTNLNLASTENNAGVLSPVALNTSYTDVLPNLMARVHFTDKLQLRLSATETRTRPDFAQYDPSASIPSPPSCMLPGAGHLNPGDPNCVRYGNAGNAALQPLTSKNYDASLEYYFSRSSFASFAVFRHDLNGFISNYNVKTTDPQGYILYLNEPFNTGKGQINGVEAQGQTFMDWGPAWLKPFGLQANVTYLDPKTGVPAMFGAPVTETDIVGVSKWTYNLAAFYEGERLSARLSWNYRSSYLSRFEYRGTDPYSETTNGIGRLDLSTTYDLTRNLKLMFDATNLLGDPDVTYLTYGFNGGKDPATFPRMIHYTEQVVSFGLRFAF